MGHAYEAVTSDVIARFARWYYPGPTYFVTGSDEHGQKIAGTAADAGKSPIDICNLYVTGFQVLNQRLLISNDDYIRTTSDRHKRTAQQLWIQCAAANDIYLDTYSGWYNVREETFVTECTLVDWLHGIFNRNRMQVNQTHQLVLLHLYRMFGAQNFVITLWTFTQLRRHCLTTKTRHPACH
jgi:hypothetical protein